MPQLLDRLSHKRRKRQLLLRDQLLEIPRDPIPAIDIERKTAIGRTITTMTKNTGATTTTIAITTTTGLTITVEATITVGAMTNTEGTIIATATTIAATTITVVTRNTIGRMTIVGTIIATSDNRGTTVSCFLLLHATTILPRENVYLDVDRRSVAWLAQSVSV